MSIQECKPIKEGKVREIYDNGDSLIMVATDRITLASGLTGKSAHTQVPSRLLEICRP